MACNIFIGEVQVPEATGSIETQSLFEALKQLQDQRGRRGRRYLVAVVLTVIIETILLYPLSFPFYRVCA